MSIILNLLLILIPFPAMSEESVSCLRRYSGDITGNESICQEWKSQPSIMQRFSDGTLVPNPLIPASSPELKPFVQNPNPTNQERLLREIDLLKRSMMDQIAGGAPEGRWTDHQRYLVYRLRTLRIQIAPSFISQGRDSCETGLNAVYSHSLNELRICNFATHLPIESVIPLLAHELGHLADPCNGVNLFPFTNQMNGSDGNPNPDRIRNVITTCLRGQNEKEISALISFALAPTRMEARGFTLSPNQEAMSEATLKKLLSCGLITKPSVSAPTQFQNSPYLPIISCVTRIYPETGSEQAVSTQPRGILGPELIPDSTSGPICDNVNTTIKECTADHIGASLTDFHLARHRSRFPQERRHLFGYFYGQNHCQEGGKPNSQYPSSDRRSNSFFQSREVQRAVGCHMESAPHICPLIQSEQASPRRRSRNGRR